MKNHLPVVDIEHSLALLGLVLMAIVGWLADRGYAAHLTIAGQVGGAIARRAIDGIAVVGWIVDHLPPSTAATNGGPIGTRSAPPRAKTATLGILAAILLAPSLTMAQDHAHGAAANARREPNALVQTVREVTERFKDVPNGRLKLTGADFLVLADAWDAAHPADPPQLMGQLFHRFEAPNRFGLPAFYTLHVWAWKDNPSGWFVNWHDNVTGDNFGGH